MNDTRLQPAAIRSRSLAWNAAVYGVGGIALQLATIVLLPVYTRHISPADFGVLELINRTGQIILILLMVNGLRMATLTFFQQADDEIARSKVAATQSLLVIAIVASLSTAVLVVSRPIARSLGVDDSSLFAFGLVSVLLESLVVVPLALMQARIEAELFVAASLGSFFLRIGLNIVLLTAFQLGLWGVLLGNAISSVVVGAALTYRELARDGFSIDWPAIPRVLRFVIPFLPGGIFGFIMLGSDRLVLNYFHSQESVGLYSLAMKLATAVAVVSVGPLHRVWASMMYRAATGENASQLFGLMYHRIMCANVLVGLAVAIFSVEALWLFTTYQYYAAATLVGPLVLGQYFFNAACVLDSPFYVRRKTGLKPWITLIGAACCVALLMLLVPRFGAAGAAWAVAGALFVYWLVTLMVAQRVMRVTFDWWRINGLLVSAIVTYAATAALEPRVYSTGWKILIYGAWLLFIWIAGLIAPQDKAALVRIAQGLSRRWAGA